MKIVVLGGAGDMGSRAARALADSSEVSELIVADINTRAAEELSDELGDKARAVYINANVPETLVQALQGADVAASALGPFYKYERPAVEAALSAHVN